MIRKRKIKVGPKKRSDMNGKYEKESMGPIWLTRDPQRDSAYLIQFLFLPFDSLLRTENSPWKQRNCEYKTGGKERQRATRLNQMEGKDSRLKQKGENEAFSWKHDFNSLLLLFRRTEQIEKVGRTDAALEVSCVTFKKTFNFFIYLFACVFWLVGVLPDYYEKREEWTEYGIDKRVVAVGVWYNPNIGIEIINNSSNHSNNKMKKKSNKRVHEIVINRITSPALSLPSPCLSFSWHKREHPSRISLLFSSICLHVMQANTLPQILWYLLMCMRGGCVWAGSEVVTSTEEQTEMGGNRCCETKIDPPGASVNMKR